MARTSKTEKPEDTTETAAARGKSKDEVVDQPLVTGQKWYHKVASFVIGSSIPEILLIASLAMARYIKNSDFSYPSEIVINIVLLGVIISGLFYLLKWILRGRILAAHIAGLALAYGLYNFSSSFPRLQHAAEWLIPNSATSFTKDFLTLIFLTVVFGLVGWGVDKIVRSNATLKSLPLVNLLIFVICFIFVTQLIKVGARMWEIRDALMYQPPAVNLTQSNAGKSTPESDKPNIYYLLFDRYANDATLDKIYAFDNSQFAEFLNAQGFVSRQDAYANYPFTMMSASSTLAMQYHTALGQQFKNSAVGFQTAFPYRAYLDNPPVAQALKQNGYKYNQVSSWWDFTRKIPAADSEPTISYEVRIFGKSFYMSDLQRDIINKSILAPLLRKGITIGDTPIIKYLNDRNPVENFNAQMDTLKQIATSSKTQSEPQFTFAHFLSPHDPYIFDETGGTPDYDQNRTDIDVDETVKYKNQLTYVNTRIEDLIKTIREKDPKAVIVLQADEGPYPKEFRGNLTSDHYYDPINLELPQMRQKFGVQASYYLPGVAQESAKQINSNVNAFRFVLSNYLGYELPMLKDCNFTVGDKFYLYNYKLVTGKLHGTDEPADCKQYQ